MHSSRSAVCCMANAHVYISVSTGGYQEGLYVCQQVGQMCTKAWAEWQKNNIKRVGMKEQREGEGHNRCVARYHYY